MLDTLHQEQIKEHNGVKYLIRPLFKRVFDDATNDIRHSHREYLGNFDVQYHSGQTNILDFRFVSPNDRIIIDNEKGISTIYLNAANLDKTYIFGNQTYQTTIYSEKPNAIGLILDVGRFLLRNRQNVYQIDFRNVDEKLLPKLVHGCQKFGVKCSPLLEKFYGTINEDSNQDLNK